jgi:AraC family transcriptional regulator
VSAHLQYAERINRAIALIDRHIDQDLSLERLAKEAAISPFHFHRIFSSLVGESVHALTTRRRMERALALTHRGKRPQWKAVASAVGYASPEVFSRAFKRHFGCNPSQFDLGKWWHERPDRDDALRISNYFLRAAPEVPADFRVEIGPRAGATCLVCRTVGGYLKPQKLVAAYERIKRAGQLLGVPLPGRLVGGSQDDPELTPLSRCRYDFMLEVPEGTRPCAGLEIARRRPGRWAMTRVTGDLQAVDRAWNILFKSWLPASAFDLRPVPAEEIYHQTPDEIGWERFNVTLAIPLKD